MKLITLGQIRTKENPNTEPKVYVDNSPSQRLLAHLRQRLVSGDYHDSVEVKTAILGEMIYLCYTECQKRRYL
jgi:hypothetical protein